MRKEHQPRPPEYSEEALALQFAERHAKDLRFVAKWGQWHSFDGRRWQAEETLLAFDKARDICREAAVRCPKPKIASTIASAKTVAAVERLAKADRRLAATPDQFDTDPWLLNTPDATIDLRTGQRKKHRPEDFITAVTGAAAGGDAPLWRAFLRKITAGDEDLQRFLQRVAGCCLTGITRDHALLFHYGTGANGKSVYTNALAGVLGDYHCSAPIETFTASSMERHPTELAWIAGRPPRNRG